MKKPCLVLLQRLLLLLPLLVLAWPGLAQTGRVTGREVDPKGDPTIGTAVVVKGTTSGTSGGTDGAFGISGLPDSPPASRVLGVWLLTKIAKQSTRIPIGIEARRPLFCYMQCTETWRYFSNTNQAY